MKKLLATVLLAALCITQTPALASDRAVVIVRLAPGASVEALHARAGSFPVYVRWHVIDALAASLTGAQRARLERDPLVRSIEPERTLHIDASTARASYGVTKAVADFGVTGDRDGSSHSFSRTDVVACVI